MRARIFAILVVVGATWGCGGEKNPPPTGPSAPAPSAPAPVSVTPPAPVPPSPPAPPDAPPAPTAPPPVAAAPPDAAPAAPPPSPSPPAGKLHLKVLPSTWTLDQVKAYMKTDVAAAVGMKCLDCHVRGPLSDDYAAETDMKKVSREMMVLTDGINRRWFAGKPRVTCLTCHLGQKEPK